MSSVSLADLPPSPPGRVGWPWTEASQPLPPTRPDGSAWPRVTIVTPSYNQGEFIEETIRSVLLQSYPNLQYMVIDGGSSDATVNVISRYAPWIDYSVSERDEGQTHAINKGLARADGEWFQFINSDDLLMPNALAAVGGAIAGATAVAGPVIQFGDGPDESVSNRALTCAHLLSNHGLYKPSTYHQPGVFLRTACVHKIGKFDQSYRYVFDYRFMVPYLDRFPRVHWIEAPVARFRLHGGSKTVYEGDRFGLEFSRARDELMDAGLSPRNRAILARINARIEWPARVLERRQNAASRRHFIGFLVREAMLRPRISMNRFTFGALRRAVFSLTDSYWSSRSDKKSLTKI